MGVGGGARLKNKILQNILSDVDRPEDAVKIVYTVYPFDFLVPFPSTTNTIVYI